MQGGIDSILLIKVLQISGCSPGDSFLEISTRDEELSLRCTSDGASTLHMFSTQVLAAQSRDSSGETICPLRRAPTYCQYHPSRVRLHVH